MPAHEHLHPKQFKRLYHETPLENRESIRRSGLLPGKGEQSMSGPSAPAGVYLSPHHRSEYGSSMNDSSWFGYDRWRVNVEGLDLHTDPTQRTAALYHPEAIPPERLQLVKKGHPDYQRHL